MRRATEITISFVDLPDTIKVLYKDNGKGTSIVKQPYRGMGTSNIESRLKMIKAILLPQDLTQKGYAFSFILSKK